jgi:hypothetical protein
MLQHHSINRTIVQLFGRNLNLKMWNALPADYQKEGVRNGGKNGEIKPK